MICPECGVQLEDGKNHCSKCGWTLEEDSVIPAENVVDTPTREDTEFYPSVILKSSHKVKSKSDLLKIIIPVAAAITIVLAVIIGVIAHYNSDDYKIKKASELIAAGSYSEGINLIQDIYTPQATTIKAFVNVEYAKQTFINSASSKNFEKYKSAYYDFYNEISSFEEENEIFYLPDNLRESYDQCRNALDFGNDYIEVDMLYENLRDAQMVMLNEVQRKHSSKDGNTFTLKTLQERIDTSKKALSELNDYDFSYIVVNDNNVVYLRDSLIETITSMISLCEYEIKSSQEHINDSLEKFDPDDKLYMTYPNPNYTSYVGEELQQIDSEDDMYTNANIIAHMIKMDITYYLLVGSTPY